MPEEPLQRRQRNISLYGGDGEGVMQDVGRYRPAGALVLRSDVSITGAAGQQ